MGVEAIARHYTYALNITATIDSIFVRIDLDFISLKVIFKPLEIVLLSKWKVSYIPFYIPNKVYSKFHGDQLKHEISKLTFTIIIIIRYGYL